MAICPYSKFAIAVAIRNEKPKTVAKVLMDHAFLKHGLVVEILRDLGPEFQAELSVELYRVLGIKQLLSMTPNVWCHRGLALNTKCYACQGCI